MKARYPASIALLLLLAVFLAAPDFVNAERIEATVSELNQTLGGSNSSTVCAKVVLLRANSGTPVIGLTRANFSLQKAAAQNLSSIGSFNFFVSGGTGGVYNVCLYPLGAGAWNGNGNLYHFMLSVRGMNSADNGAFDIPVWSGQ